MGYIRWGGKKWYPQKPQPRKPDINELMKPLSEKVNKGNVWGSVIMNVEKGTTPPTPPSVPEFQFSVDTTIAGTSGVGKFQLPLVSSLPLNAVVDWGDGNTDTITTYNQAETLHTYSSAGEYTITITGDISGWQFNNAGDRLKMKDIKKWEALNISVSAGFRGCSNMTCSATDAPTISTTSLERYFQSCSLFNGAIGNWDVSNVSNFTSMFNSALVFNQNIGTWNTSNATTFSEMFSSATNFNNGGSDSIKNWNTSSVLSMFRMFRTNNAFNQPIGSWDVSSVTNMLGMFYQVIPFNQDISDWNISNVSNFTGFMGNKGAANYSATYLDNIYNKWSLLSVVSGLTIDFGTIKYTAAGQSGKDVLTNAPNNWVIIDGGT